MALQFGIFRRLPGMEEKEVFHLDEASTKGRLFELLLLNLPKSEEKRVFRKIKSRTTWTRDEIEAAFRVAWSQLRRGVQQETLRIR